MNLDSATTHMVIVFLFPTDKMFLLYFLKLLQNLSVTVVQLKANYPVLTISLKKNNPNSITGV